MGSAQTVILPYGQPFGYAGQVTRREDSKSAANKEASLNIGFGLGVKPGTNPNEAKLPTASSSVLLGITLNEGVYAPGTFGNVDQTSTVKGMIPGTMMECLTEGRCYVVVDGDAAVTPGVTRLYWRFETDGASNTLVGTFRHSDDGHVVDTTKQVLAVGPIVAAADVLTGGTQKICEVYVSTSNKP